MLTTEVNKTVASKSTRAKQKQNSHPETPTEEAPKGLGNNSLYNVNFRSRTPTLYKLTLGLRHASLYSTRSFCAICDGSGWRIISKATMESATSALDLCKYCPNPALLADRYQAIRILGEGTHSRVFLVRDLFLVEGEGGELLVVKMANRGMEMVLWQEASILHRLNVLRNGNRIPIPKIHGLLCEHGHVGMVLPYMQEVSIRPSNYNNNTFHQRSPSDKIQMVGMLIANVSASLHQLHSISLIHADIKRQNILYSKYENKFYLIDYGNAVSVLPKYGQLKEYFEDFDIQSMAYRAPEVLLGIPFAEKIDCWSLGVVGLELLMEKLPFAGDERRQMLEQICALFGPLSPRFAGGKFADNLPETILTSSVDKDAEIISPVIMKRWKSSILAQFVGVNDARLIDLLVGMLEYDESSRFSTLEILRHPFLSPWIPFPP